MSSHIPFADPEAHEQDWAEWQEWLAHCDDDPRVRPIVEPTTTTGGSMEGSNYPAGVTPADPHFFAEDAKACSECDEPVYPGEECASCGTYEPTDAEYAEDAALEAAEAAREIELGY